VTRSDELERVYLTLPNHEVRCLCGVFGLPNLRRVVDLAGGGVVHEADRCQPLRESTYGGCSR
jgi:hypothetical protein